MGKTRFAFLASLLCAGATFGVAGAAPATPAEITRALDARVAEHPGTGIIAGFIDNGKVAIYQAGSSGTSRPLDEHTLFEIGSVTKTFTSAVLAELAMQGKVHLSDPVQKYLPGSVRVPSKNGKQITLLDLATQHSGLPRLATNMQGGSDDPYATYSADQLYEFLNSYALTRDPGDRFEYSNLGFGLLGFALARDVDMPYGAMVRHYVFAPLEMNESGTSLNAQQKALFGQGHDDTGAAVHAWDFSEPTAGAGAIRSNMVDMLKYLRAAMGSGPLANAFLFAEEPRSSFPGHHIGLAWWINDESHYIDHGGDTAGFHSIVLMTGDRKRGVVMLSNGAQVGDLAVHFIDTSNPLAPPQKTLKLAPSALDEYTGKYANESDGITYIIERAGDGLRAQIVGQPAAGIYASRPDHFYYKVVAAYIEFVRNNGKVVGLILTQNGQQLAIYKLDDKGKPMATQLTPAYPPVVTLDSGTVQSYVGTYELQGVRMQVSIKDGHVFAKLADQDAYEIYPSARDDFYYKIVDAQLTFMRDSNGAITSVKLTQNGTDQVFVKNKP